MSPQKCVLISARKSPLPTLHRNRNRLIASIMRMRRARNCSIKLTSIPSNKTTLVASPRKNKAIQTNRVSCLLMKINSGRVLSSTRETYGAKGEHSNPQAIYRSPLFRYLQAFRYLLIKVPPFLMRVLSERSTRLSNLILSRPK